ncbi:hypothetical protein [Paenibacillus polymyxa]|nr:hypothetical protein [Paenibacillus polymyxa]
MNRRKFCAGRYTNGRLYVQTSNGVWTDISSLIQREENVKQ